MLHRYLNLTKKLHAFFIAKLHIKNIKNAFSDS